MEWVCQHDESVCLKSCMDPSTSSAIILVHHREVLGGGAEMAVCWGIHNYCVSSQGTEDS